MMRAGCIHACEASHILTRIWVASRSGQPIILRVPCKLQTPILFASPAACDFEPEWNSLEKDFFASSLQSQSNPFPFQPSGLLSGDEFRR